MNINYFNFILPFCLLSGTVSYAGTCTDPVRVLLITGGTPVKYNKTMVPTSLYSVFNNNKNIIWDHASLDEAAFLDDLRDLYDVLVFFNRSDSLSTNAQNNLRNFVESGKGIVVLHSGLSSYNNWEWWWKDVVGGKYQYSDKNQVTKSGFVQDEVISLTPELNHQITDAVGNFKIKDEFYTRLILSPNIKVLYRTNHPKSDGPMVWIGPNKKSRVIAIQPGHYPSTYLDREFQVLLYNSILWVGHKESLIVKNIEEQNDFNAIREVIEKAYIDGIHSTQNEEKIRSGFYKDFVMLVFKDDEMEKVTIERWLERIEKMKKDNPVMWASKNCYEGLEINIVGYAASVKIKVFKGNKFFSTDYMLLYKFKDGWKIVSKIFTIKRD